MKLTTIPQLIARRLELSQHLTGKVSAFLLLATILFQSTSHADSVVIRNAAIAGMSETQDILVSDGYITSVGASVSAPDGTIEFNAAGSIVTPGYIDSGTPIGLAEVENAGQTKDNAVEGVQLSAGFDTSLAINRRSSLIGTLTTEGVTTAIVVPSPGEHMFAGMSTVLTTAGDRRAVGGNALHVFIDEPHRRFAGGSRGAVMQQLRHALTEAGRYQKNRRAFDSGRVRDFAFSKADLEALVQVLDGAMPLVAHVDRAGDIENLLSVLKPFNVKLILASAAEAWQVADQLAEASVPVLLNVLENRPRSFDRLGARLDNAALLAEAGVMVAMMTTDPYTDFRSLSQAAGVAVAYGLPKAEALRAITSNPATIWGLNNHGSLKVGFVADLVVWDGDPLEVTSAPVRVMVQGSWVDLRTRQDMLRDRYVDLENRDARFGYR